MLPDQMATAVRHHWWLFLLRGIAALAFGVITLLQPGATLVVLMAFIIAYALVDGVVALVYAFRLRPMLDRWWMLLIQGVITHRVRCPRHSPAVPVGCVYRRVGGFLDAVRGDRAVAAGADHQDYGRLAALGDGRRRPDACARDRRGRFPARDRGSSARLRRVVRAGDRHRAARRGVPRPISRQGSRGVVRRLPAV